MWGEMDFEIFRVLGRGGFGLVNGCRCIRTGKVYAMKTMDKRRVKMNRGAQMCIFEKELLECCNSRVRVWSRSVIPSTVAPDLCSLVAVRT